MIVPVFFVSGGNMKILIKICLLILFVGCGKRGIDIRTSDSLPVERNIIDNRLLEFVEGFEHTFKKTVWMDVIITEELEDYAKGGLLEDNVVGVCWKSVSGETRRIEIKQSSFDDMSYKAKEQLIFHELGHCVLDKGHSDPQNIFTVLKEDGCKSSIMDVYTFSQSEISGCYQPQYNYYIKELKRL